MKTKRIWLWSFVFGIFAAGLVYFAFNSSTSIPASAPEEEAAEEEAEDEELEEEVEEELERFTNPIVEVSEGKRAISLDVAYIHEGVSGFIEPESYIDIIAFDSDLDEEENEFLNAELVLQKVKVLATGAATQNLEESINYTTITVEVTPEEGVMLSLAGKHDEGFYFMLRHVDDEGIETEIIRYTTEILKKEEEEE